MSLLPGSIADERFLALEQVWAQRLAALPIEVVLIKFIREAPEAALPHLADEFGALDEVWNSASEAEKVALLERALARRRHRGTRWAVRDALSAIGFDPVEMRFRPDLLADGSLYADGTFPAAGQNRFVFWLVLLGPLLEGAALARVVKAFLAWRQRSVHLGELYYVAAPGEFGDPTRYESEYTAVVFLGASVPPVGTELRLSFSRPLDPASLPAPGDFAVTGAPVTVTTVAVDGEECVLTLDGGVSPIESITIDYTPGANRLRSALTRNEAPALDAVAVDNESEWLPYIERALLWVSSKDSTEVINAAGEITSVPNLGTLGGAVVPATGNGPEAVGLGNKQIGWNTTNNGGLQLASNTALQLLHDPTSNALVSMRFRVTNPASDARLLMTRNPAADSRGFWLQVSGSDVRLVLSNGAVDTLTLAGGADLSQGYWYTFQVRKSALLFETVLDGGAYLSGSASSLTSGVQGTAVQIGSSLTDSARLQGILTSCVVHSGAFSNSEMARVRQYLEHNTETVAVAHPRYHTCLFHFQADHPANAISSGNFASAPNLGSLGGALTPGTGSGPERVLINGRPAARTTANGSLIYGTTSSFQLLHDPASTATIAIAVNVEVAVPSANKRLLSTKGSAATARGVILYHTAAGTLQLAVSDGATNVLSIAGTQITAGLHSFIVTKSALAFAFYLDGVLYASGAASALTSGAHDSVFSLGSTSSDTTNFDGSIFESSVLSAALSVGEVAQLHQNLAARWAGESV